MLLSKGLTQYDEKISHEHVPKMSSFLVYGPLSLSTEFPMWKKLLAEVPSILTFAICMPINEMHGSSFLK
jgi:hypothetical protein